MGLISNKTRKKIADALKTEAEKKAEKAAAKEG